MTNKYDENITFTKHESVILKAQNNKYYGVPLQLHYTTIMPDNCADCPVGFMVNKCGRNVPFSSEDYEKRQSTCKLKLLDNDLDKLLLLNLIKEYNNQEGVDGGV